MIKQTKKVFHIISSQQTGLLFTFIPNSEPLPLPPTYQHCEPAARLVVAAAASYDVASIPREWAAARLHPQRATFAVASTLPGTYSNICPQSPTCAPPFASRDHETLVNTAGEGDKSIVQEAMVLAGFLPVSLEKIP